MFNSGCAEPSHWDRPSLATDPKAPPKATPMIADPFMAGECKGQIRKAYSVGACLQVKERLSS